VRSVEGRVRSRAPRRGGALVSAAAGLGADAVGRGLARAVGALARRRRDKPMHPRGVVYDAVLERTGSRPPWGVGWLDEPATDRVVVRISRGAGLPRPWPDLLGLAVRVPGSAPVDLLLSSCGRGRRTRLLPVLRRDVGSGYGSIMGYRSDAGTLRLGAVGEQRHGGERSEPVFVFAAARGREPWRPFARLTLTARTGDPDVRFDAVRRPPPGLVPDGPMARLRAPAYAAAREARDAEADPGGPERR
jgi:hypothetical protein